MKLQMQIKKRFLSILCLTLFAASFGTMLFAQDKETSTDSADAYEESYEDFKPKTSTKKKNGFLTFLFGEDEYVEYDVSKLYTRKAFGGIKLSDITLVFNKKTHKAGIKFHYQASFFVLTLDVKARVALQEAVTQYLKDFEQKALIKNKPTKTGYAYGKYDCDIKWGTTSVMMNAIAKTGIRYGYAFEKKSPYFKITIDNAKNQAEDVGAMSDQKSIDMYLYMTKAQAQQLAELLSDKYVSEQILKVEEELPGTGIVNTDGDDYE